MFTVRSPTSTRGLSSAFEAPCSCLKNTKAKPPFDTCRALTILISPKCSNTCRISDSEVSGASPFTYTALGTASLGLDAEGCDDEIGDGARATGVRGAGAQSG